EILYELREHSAGLNAGRWDYMFSIIKKFRNRPGFAFPDRVQVTMTVPFMRAYTNLLVQTCHKRGAHAMGGMAAYIPNRKNPEINEIALAKVHDDKLRESGDGFDGTWVAHPDLVPVAMEVFKNALGDKPHQKDRLREDVHVTGPELITFDIAGGQITEAGLRTNISVGIMYLESWLRGSGAVAIYNLMEDAATAEISRAQVWQWIHNPQTRLADGRPVTKELYRSILPEEIERIKEMYGEKLFNTGKFELAEKLFDELAAGDEFCDFLTLMAYPYL
ncbi:MAG: malate synthase, partial [Chloroflexota bacterium]